MKEINKNFKIFNKTIKNISLLFTGFILIYFSILWVQEPYYIMHKFKLINIITLIFGIYILILGIYNFFKKTD